MVSFHSTNCGRRFYLRLIFDEQKSCSFRRMDFMSADRKHINPQFFRKNTVLSICLDRIHMYQCIRIFFFDHLDCFFDRFHCSDLIVDHLYQIKQRFVEGVLKIEGVSVNGKTGRDSAPQIVSVSIDGVRSEVMLHTLEDRKIYVSAGSACSSKFS